MNFNSRKWKDEVLGKTFVPEAEEMAVVDTAMERIGQLLGVTGKEETLREIVMVAVYDSYEITAKRVSGDLK